jgi:hypothetical protein
MKKLVKIIIGSPEARAGYQCQLKESLDFQQRIKALSALVNLDTNPNFNDSPIFIFSAGWRSGSTLLQRLITSSENILLWGEPYDRCNIVQSMSDTLLPFSDTWPPRRYIVENTGFTDFSQEWIANLYPPANALIQANRAYFTKMFAEPALATGATRWGIKEVRFGKKEALYLKLLYPDARFLFLTRDLSAAYLSYKSFSSVMNWYTKWPHHRAFTPYSFAKHRANLIKQFQEVQKETDGLMIDYSELTSDNPVLDKLDVYCGVKCNRTVLSKKVGSGLKRDASNVKHTPTLNWFEKLALYAGNQVIDK